MSKRILLIDSDEGFAQKLSGAVEAHGFFATVATDSEQGMSMARDEGPDLIVVCVEAQPTNGYMLCTRLKKDEQLKGIPVVLTSSHATPDSFEKHKKLKTRAEEYLIKPFAPDALLEKVAQLLGVGGGEEQIVSVEDEPLGLVELVEGEDEPISLSAADVAEARSALTEEPLVVEEVEEVVELEASAGDNELEMFDKAFDSLGTPPPPTSTSRFADAQLTQEAAADDFGAAEEELALDPIAPPEPVRPQPALKPPPRPNGAVAAPKKVDAGASKATDDLKARIARLEKELESARAEVAALTGERDQLAGERDSLQSQLEELQASAGQNEDRAVKAYNRIKSQDKLREKARKALAIALQLLEDGRPEEDEEDGKKVSAKA